ncbi:MAG TPA: phage holin family protein [Gallionellaceae bacterium]
MSGSSGLLESLRRLGGTLLAILHTRLELLSNEIEEELLRLGQILVYGIVALFLFFMSILVLMIFVVALFWDTYRLQVLGGLTALFLVAGLLVCYALRCAVRQRSKLFSGSLAELAQDRDQLTPRP